MDHLGNIKAHHGQEQLQVLDVDLPGRVKVKPVPNGLEVPQVIRGDDEIRGELALLERVTPGEGPENDGDHYIEDRKGRKHLARGERIRVGTLGTSG